MPVTKGTIVDPENWTTPSSLTGGPVFGIHYILGNLEPDESTRIRSLFHSRSDHQTTIRRPSLVVHLPVDRERCPLQSPRGETVFASSRSILRMSALLPTNLRKPTSGPEIQSKREAQKTVKEALRPAVRHAYNLGWTPWWLLTTWNLEDETA